MEYNAIVYEYTGKSVKVVGRVLVTDLNDIPKDYAINYCLSPIDRKTTSIEQLCCGPKNPLQIFKTAENGFTIFIRNVFGKTLDVVVEENYTVKALKDRIFNVTETYNPKQQQLFVNHNHQQKKLKDSSFLSDYGIFGGSSIFLKPKLEKFLSGVKYKAIDLESNYPRINKRVTGSCAFTLGSTPPSSSPEWANYSAGLNLVGSCPNLDCDSKILEMDVVIKMGYGEMCVTLKDSQFICPACYTSLIFPDKYLVSCARAQVHYKRDKEEHAITAQLIECDGPGDQFQEIYLGHPFMIEISTVEPWRSPYTCMGCGTSVLFKNQEYIMDCEHNHVYHKWCKPSFLRKGFGKCKVCKGKNIALSTV